MDKTTEVEVNTHTLKEGEVEVSQRGTMTSRQPVDFLGKISTQNPEFPCKMVPKSKQKFNCKPFPESEDDGAGLVEHESAADSPLEEANSLQCYTVLHFPAVVPERDQELEDNQVNNDKLTEKALVSCSHRIGEGNDDFASEIEAAVLVNALGSSVSTLVATDPERQHYDDNKQVNIDRLTVLPLVYSAQEARRRLRVELLGVLVTNEEDAEGLGWVNSQLDYAKQSPQLELKGSLDAFIVHVEETTIIRDEAENAFDDAPEPGVTLDKSEEPQGAAEDTLVAVDTLGKATAESMTHLDAHDEVAVALITLEEVSTIMEVPHDVHEEAKALKETRSGYPVGEIFSKALASIRTAGLTQWGVDVLDEALEDEGVASARSSDAHDISIRIHLVDDDYRIVSPEIAKVGMKTVTANDMEVSRLSVEQEVFDSGVKYTVGVNNQPLRSVPDGCVQVGHGKGVEVALLVACDDQGLQIHILHVDCVPVGAGQGEEEKGEQRELRVPPPDGGRMHHLHGTFTAQVSSQVEDGGVWDVHLQGAVVHAGNVLQHLQLLHGGGECVLHELQTGRGALGFRAHQDANTLDLSDQQRVDVPNQGVENLREGEVHGVERGHGHHVVIMETCDNKEMGIQQVPGVDATNCQESLHKSALSCSSQVMHIHQYSKAGVFNLRYKDRDGVHEELAVDHEEVQQSHGHAPPDGHSEHEEDLGVREIVGVYPGLCVGQQLGVNQQIPGEDTVESVGVRMMDCKEPSQAHTIVERFGVLQDLDLQLVEVEGGDQVCRVPGHTDGHEVDQYVDVGEEVRHYGQQGLEDELEFMGLVDQAPVQHGHVVLIFTLITLFNLK